MCCQSRSKRWSLMALFMALCLLSAGLAAYAPAYAAPAASPEAPEGTIVSGNITGSITWTLAGSPYTVTGNATLLSGATLTIQPDVQVRFDQYRGLTVYGTLLTLGTSGHSVVFTANNSTQAGWWGGIYVRGAPAQATFNYTTVEYGGYNQAGNIEIYDQPVVTVTHSMIRNGTGDGINASSGAVAHVSDTTLQGNARYALYYEDGAVDPQLANLTITGNGQNAVAFGGGTLVGNRRWKNLGVPYMFTGNQTLAQDAVLTVDPGVQARFDQYRGLTVYGTLNAAGTPAQPIVFTPNTAAPQPGWWGGLYVRGAAARLVLDYATVEYGGYNQAGNIELYDEAQASISRSTLAHSSDAGLVADSGGAGISIVYSQVVDNAGYGVSNEQPADVLMAVNNWWGSAAGPLVDGGCNPGGTGSKVSAGVAFRPFMTQPGTVANPLTPRDQYSLEISPGRWFVPADDVSPAWVTVTLRNGAGVVVPNTAVHLATSLGSASSTELITNAAGQAHAYITSAQAGKATVTATSGYAPGTCANAAQPASTEITFTPAEEAPLMPNGEAPYMNNNIEVEPQPITQGVPSTITLRLTNPYPQPITVDGTLGYLQYGIGQIFGPVREVRGWVIPPNTEQALNVPWVPPLEGHYCLEFRYSFTGGGQNMPQDGRVGRAGLNMNVKRGSNNSRGDKSILDRARKAIGWFDTLFGGRATGLDLPRKGAKVLTNWQLDTAETISKEMGGDPPRQDYTIIAVPQRPVVPPLQPGADPNGYVSPAMAAAYNAFVSAQLDANAYGNAILISWDRSGGASEAGDDDWVAQQTAAVLYFQKQMGQSLLAAASALDSIHATMIAEGVPDSVQTAADVQAYQNRLRTQGFSQAEIDAAHLLGLTDAEIEAARQEILAADPASGATGMRAYQVQLAATYRELADMLMNPHNFPNQIAGGLSAEPASADAAGSANNLAQFYATTATLQVGNPLTQTARVDLEVRRIDLPGDWLVTTDWSSATLQPGQQITATVTIAPGSASVQGTRPRAAVEGYVGDTMIGGVVVAVTVPRYVPFRYPNVSYLPLLTRAK
jgi:hypothetical protein